MGKARKWRPGRAVTCIQDFQVMAARGSLFYWGTDPKRPKHHSIVENMAFSCVRNAIAMGQLRVAEPNKGGER